MKYISSKDINLGFTLIILLGVSVLVGFVKLPFLIFSIIFLFSYIVLDKKRLRCPNCGGFENLDRLMYAKKKVYHCRHCGEIIKVLK
ncbi:hypothetical protein [Sporosarcina sp. FA9]|uniref:hypothetical protein n=1 Tax=Sporosarcina sp. FA9 TaxID=3413030 RepID=UPI003F65C0F8